MLQQQQHKDEVLAFEMKEPYTLLGQNVKRKSFVEPDSKVLHRKTI